MDRSRLVLVTATFAEAWLERLRALAPALRVERRPAPAAAIPDEVWRGVEVLYAATGLPRPEQAPGLRWVQLHSAGAEHVLEHPLFAGGVAFTTTSGAHAIALAEYVMAMLLAWTHRVPRMLEWQRRGRWPPDEQRWPLFAPRELWGQSMGVLGYGSIGRQVARLARAFGMRVLTSQRGADRRDRGFVVPGAGDPEGILPERYYPPEQLHELLGASDVVVVAVPLTPATRGLLDAAAFRAMRPGALLVNVARGAVVDEEALVDALREGRIGAAALDVFQREPLPEGHPLWSLPNALLSPHVAGFTPAYDERAAELFTDNLRRYLAGEPLLNRLDGARGY